MCVSVCGLHAHMNVYIGVCFMHGWTGLLLFRFQRKFKSADTDNHTRFFRVLTGARVKVMNSRHNAKEGSAPEVLPQSVSVIIYDILCLLTGGADRT